MANPTQAVGDSPVDQKSWPLKWQACAWVFVTVLNAVITLAPFKGDEKDKNKEVYTKAEVQQMLDKQRSETSGWIDTAVSNIRYSQQADIDDLYNWTQNNFQYNGLPTLQRPTAFRDRSPPQPGYPQRQPQEPVLPPREVPHQKKPP